MPASPNLVLLHDNLAYRYVQGKLDQVVEVDYSLPIPTLLQEIELLRLHGIEFDAEQGLE